MSHKELLFGSVAREKVRHGSTALANAVRVTLGPKSKSVLIEKKWGTPIVCNDGVTTSALLAYAIFSEGLRNLAAGARKKDIHAQPSFDM